MNTNLSERSPKQCRACDNQRGNKLVPKFHSVYECAKCGALFGDCYLGDSYSLVRPHLAVAEVAQADQRYFDFTTVGSAGLARRHGWFDINSKLITQIG